MSFYPCARMAKLFFGQQTITNFLLHQEKTCVFRESQTDLRKEEPPTFLTKKKHFSLSRINF